MGNRIAAALTFLNAIGLLGCLILLAAASGQVPDIAIQIIHAMKYSLQMFVFGAVLPVIIWSIAASEINRSNVKVKLIEDWGEVFLAVCFGSVVFRRSVTTAKLDHFKLWARRQTKFYLTRFGSVQFWAAVGLPERRGSGRWKRRHKSSFAGAAASTSSASKSCVTVRRCVRPCRYRQRSAPPRALRPTSASASASIGGNKAKLRRCASGGDEVNNLLIVADQMILGKTAICWTFGGYPPLTVKPAHRDEGFWSGQIDHVNDAESVVIDIGPHGLMGRFWHCHGHRVKARCGSAGSAP